MDTLKHYRNVIKKLLMHYYDLSTAADRASHRASFDRLAFDVERDQYLWFCSGWEGKKRVQHITMYLQIKGQKIWVEEDNTDLGLVDDLLEQGIPKTDIVLGFHHPSKRELTEFATA